MSEPRNTKIVLNMSRADYEEWLAALRSGEYNQTRSQLRRRILQADEITIEHAYCCLGVLCDLQAKKGNGNWLSDDESDLYKVNTSVQNYHDFVPEKWIDYETQRELSTMNDGTDGFKAHTFEEIADYIEDNLTWSHE